MRQAGFAPKTALGTVGTYVPVMALIPLILAGWFVNVELNYVLKTNNEH